MLLPFYINQTFICQALWLFSHGVDDRPVDAFKGRRSIGAECNYGVRCASVEDAERVLHGLAAEVSSRLKAAGGGISFQCVVTPCYHITLPGLALVTFNSLPPSLSPALSEEFGIFSIESVPAGLRGKSITLKVKRRQEGAPEPAKFLGHGWCDNVSRSVTIASFSDNTDQVWGINQEPWA